MNFPESAIPDLAFHCPIFLETSHITMGNQKKPGKFCNAKYRFSFPFFARFEAVAQDDFMTLLRRCWSGGA
jgi:hypothetical protein